MIRKEIEQPFPFDGEVLRARSAHLSLWARERAAHA
jgi:hypothetical protein